MGKRVRVAHRLKRAASSSTYRNLLFYDTETHIEARPDGGESHTFRLGVATHLIRRGGTRPDTQTTYVLRTPADFWAVVIECCRAKSRLVMVAHNQVFDLTILDAWRQLPERGFTITSLYERSPVFIMQAVKDKLSLLAIDNANFWPGSLVELAASTGLPKIDVDFRACTDEELLAHCARDVEIMVAAWSRWLNEIKTEDLGPAPVTRSQHAMNAYRRRFQPADIWIHTDHRALRLERESYFGGRCECFHVGVVPTSPVYVLDVNSQYPSVMSGHLYPTKLLRYLDYPTPAEVTAARRSGLLIAEVELETDVPAFPVRRDGRLMFPVGRFQTTLATPELRLAYQLGAVVGVRAMAVYSRAKLFDAYVAYFTAKKERADRDGDALMRAAHKLTGNALYGKFGQRGAHWDVVGKCDPSELGYWIEYVGDDPTPVYHRKLAGVIQRHVVEGETFDSFPAIAAHVTSYARVAMWGLLEAAGRSDVYYVDTDSLFASRAAWERLAAYIDPHAMGELALEKTIDHLELVAPKFYIADGVRTCKGIRKDAREIEPRVFLQESWPGLSTLIREGVAGAYPVREQRRALTSNYTKGVVTPSGAVLPHRLQVPAGAPF